jgi:GT2 family glycosyltransferase
MKIAFCIPGNKFSNFFLKNWTNLIQSLPEHIEWKLFDYYHTYLFKLRNKILSDAKEWDPDYYMWIDSDINFKPEQFYQLLEYNESLVSGLYFMKTPELLSRQPGPNGYEFACHGIHGSWLTTRHVQGLKGLVEVKANGMGWMLVKSKVFDNLNNPFNPIGSIDNNIIGEDIAFQMRAADNGYKSYIDPSTIVGHEKTVILK